jgi:hypothetical protein
MLKAVGAIVIVSASAGLVLSWRESCIRKIGEMEQLCELYRSASHRMQNEHISMPLFFAGYTSAHAGRNTAVETFAHRLGALLAARAYPTGEEAWTEAVQSVGWHLGREEMALLMQSKRAFFGRDMSDNLQKLSACEAQMQDCLRRARADFSEKKRVFPPVGLLMGVLLVVILI